MQTLLYTIKASLRDWGQRMIGISWGVCAAISAAGVAAVSVLSGLFSSAAKQLSLNITNPLLLLGFLVLYGFPAAIAIGIIALILKGLLYGIGNYFIRLGETFVIPNILIPIDKSETKRFFRTTEKMLDRRSKVLKKLVCRSPKI